MLQEVNYKIQKDICSIFNFFGRINRNITPVFREKLLIASFMLISVCAYCYMILPFSVHLLWKCVIGAFLMFMVVFFSVDREMHPVKWNKWIVIPWFLFGIFRFISGLIVSIEYLPLACIWLFGFPAIFLIWNNRKDYLKLFHYLYKGFAYPTMVFFILSLSFSPIGEKPYTGITTNANAVGLFIASVFPLILVKFILEDTWSKRNIFNTILMWLAICFAFLSRGRTITLVILGVTIICIIAIVFFVKKGWQYILKKLVVLILGSVVVLFVVIPLNSFFTTYLPNYTYEFSEYKDGVNVDTAFEGFMVRMEGKDKAASGVNNYSSGRIGIWQEALSKLNLTGHPSRNHIVTERNGNVGNNAHNVFIQFAYDNGIIAGVCFVILIFFSILVIIKRGFEVENHKELYVILLSISASYICEGIVTSINLPFLYIISFAYYLVYAPLFEDGFDKAIENVQ